jgi:hypothetical protein
MDERVRSFIEECDLLQVAPIQQPTPDMEALMA